MNSSEPITDAKDIASSFNIHFTEIGPKLASQIPLPVQGKTLEKYLTKVDSTFCFTKIRPSRVLKLLQTSDVAKAIGIDNISNKIVKLCAPYIYESLSAIFNLSLETNVVPSDWKIAKATPIFKVGDRCDRNKYRPISVISTVVRIFEKLVYEQLENYVTNNNFINARQSGFRPLFSIKTALLDLTDEWCCNIDRKFINGDLFLDHKKVFDTVDHTILIKKLQYLGLNAILHYKRGTSVSQELSNENQNGRHFVTSLQFESARFKYCDNKFISYYQNTSIS